MVYKTGPEVYKKYTFAAPPARGAGDESPAKRQARERFIHTNLR
jgi:hypothetical protein